MKITEYTGDVFAAEGPLAHGVNTKGVMGAGVAKIVRQKYPNTYEVYKELCRAELLRPGTYVPVLENGRWVFNMATQEYPGANATLELITSSFTLMARHTKLLDFSHVNMPRIGCGIGGLTWPEVRATLEVIDSDLELHVYTLPEGN